MSLRVKLLTAEAKLPTRGSAFAAGYDLCAAYRGVVPARGKALIKTDIAIAVPPGTYGRVGASQRRARFPARPPPSPSHLPPRNPPLSSL
jgi:dUTPase